MFIYSLTFFKMDSSSECGTKLDFSNESIPPPLIKTVSDPVIEIKKADTFTKKAFDSKWPFDDYRSRLSEAEICFNHVCLLLLFVSII